MAFADVSQFTSALFLSLLITEALGRFLTAE